MKLKFIKPKRSEGPFIKNVTLIYNFINQAPHRVCVTSFKLFLNLIHIKTLAHSNVRELNDNRLHFMHTVTFWVLDKSGFLMVQTRLVVKCSSLQMVVCDPTENVWFMGLNVRYSNGPPNHLIRPFENQIKVSKKWNVQISGVYLDVDCINKAASDNFY